MSKPVFEVLVSCGQYSDFYTECLIKNMLETCSGEVDFVISLGVNNFDQFDHSCLDKFRDKVKIQSQTINTNTPPGSVGHAIVLDKMLADCKEEYCLITDCDIAFLMQDWDTKLLNGLVDNTGIIGTEYYHAANYPKYLGFPTAVVCLFKTEDVRSLNISFMTKQGASIVSNSTEQALWGRRVGETIWLDTGWELPTKMKPAGFKGKTLTYAQPTVLGIGQEWHLDGKPFLTHLKGSSERARTDPHTLNWLSRINNYVTNTGARKRTV